MTTVSILLRKWKDEDIEPFAAMNADPEVMRFFPTKRVTEDVADCRGRGDGAQGCGFISLCNTVNGPIFAALPERK